MLADVALALIASAPLADPATSRPGRRAASLADRAGPLGRRDAAADRQPDLGHGLAGGHRGGPGARRGRRPATKPAGVALSTDGRRGVVTHWYGYDLAVLDVGSDKLEVVGRVEVGPEPRGVAICRRRPDGVRRRRGEQRGGPRRPRRAARSRAASPSAASRAGWRSRPTARACSSATPGRRDLSRDRDRPVAGRADLADRGGQPPAGGHHRRRQDGLRRQHEEPRVRHHAATTSTWAGSSASA